MNKIEEIQQVFKEYDKEAVIHKKIHQTLEKIREIITK